MAVKIMKLSPERVEDYFQFFDKVAFADHPEWGCDCYCCFYHAANANDWEAQTGSQNRAIAREMIMAGQLQGQMAYVDGLPVAWCHYDRKSKLPGLAVFYPELVGDDASVAAIVCFTVAQGYRGQGLAKSLLAAACADLAAQGCAVVEAYPRTADSSVEQHYHGPLSLYLGQGFTVARQLNEQAVVVKTFQ